VALIEIRDLVKKYDNHLVLNHINLDVFDGDIKVIMGPSGCGKSTLLRCLNRLVEPSSGSINFRGKNIMDADVDIRELRQSIGFVFQQFALFRHLSVLENVTLGLRKLRGMSVIEANDKAHFELSRLGMSQHHAKYPGQLSGGQKQRVALARALAMDPAVVVFDEPTSALDPVMTREVAEVINQLHKDAITMICVTHDLQLASQISDKVVFLDKGVIVAEESIHAFSAHHSDEKVRNFFGSGV
jgi:polar amino acid transport system ATP-binding protein